MGQEESQGSLLETDLSSASPFVVVNLIALLETLVLRKCFIFLDTPGFSLAMKIVHFDPQFSILNPRFVKLAFLPLLTRGPKNFFRKALGETLIAFLFYKYYSNFEHHK